MHGSIFYMQIYLYIYKYVCTNQHVYVDINGINIQNDI